MSAALALLPPPPELPAEECYLRANATPTTIGDGTAVRTNPFGGWSKPTMTDEGVVIEVIPPGERVQSQRVALSPRQRSSGSKVTRYVVQMWERRVLREAREMIVISL